MIKTPHRLAFLGLMTLAACGAPEEDDIGVTEDMRSGELAEGPSDGASMDLDREDLARPGEGMTELLDSDVRGDLLAVARGDGRFTTLLAAVEAAGLSGALSSGRYTLLAPTDAAFDALPEGTVDMLLDPENRSELTTILQYHLLEGAVPSSAIEGVIEGQTLAGDALALERVGDRVQVGGEGGAVVTDADVEASNGVIHVIDSVLLPPGE